MLDQDQIQEILPHRPPMLLLDRVGSCVPGKTVQASHHVPEELPLFKGHFPDNPILPGVYVVECMGQAADILVLTMPRYQRRQALLLGIRNASFYRKIYPGADIELHAELIHKQEEKAIVTCKCCAYVDGFLSAECEIALALR